MKRTMVVVLIVTCALASASVCMEFRRDAGMETDILRRREQNIKALNLINGLYLTEYQVGQILDILYELRELKAGFENRAAGELVILEDRYSALEADLIDDDMVDDETERAAAVQKQKIDRMGIEYKKELSALNGKLNDVFDEKQLEIIEDYQPCVIPPKNDNNTKIGQSGGKNLRAVRVMQQMRNLERWEFESGLSHQIAMSIRQTELKRGVYEDEERRREIDRITELAWRIYEMDNMEYEILKNDLAEELRPMLPQQALSFEDRKKSRNYRTEPGGPERKYDLNKAGKIFLDVGLIDVLEAKLEKM